jgi:hypothetical protein
MSLAMHESDEHRLRLAQGLIDAAIWIVNNPAAPVPETVTIQYSPPGSDAVKTAEVEMTAALIGQPAASTSDDLAHIAGRDFGPVRYRAVAVTAAARQRNWASLTSDEPGQPGTEAAA